MTHNSKRLRRPLGESLWVVLEVGRPHWRFRGRTWEVHHWLDDIIPMVAVHVGVVKQPIVGVTKHLWRQWSPRNG